VYIRGIFFSRMYVVDSRRDSIFTYFRKRGVTFGLDHPDICAEAECKGGMPMPGVESGTGMRKSEGLIIILNLRADPGVFVECHLKKTRESKGEWNITNPSVIPKFHQCSIITVDYESKFESISCPEDSPPK